MSDQSPPPADDNEERPRRSNAQRNRIQDRRFALEQARRNLNKAKQNLADARKEKRGETELSKLQDEVDKMQRAFDRLDNADGRQQLDRRVNQYLDRYYSRYGWWVRELVQQDPQLRRVFQRSIRQGLTPDEFIDELMRTDWWKDPEKDQTWRDAFMLEFGLSKGDWNAAVEDAEMVIQDVADEVLGRQLTEYELDQVTRQYIYQGWGKNQARELRTWLVTQAQNQGDSLSSAEQRLQDAEKRLQDAKDRGARRDVLQRLREEVRGARSAVASANEVAGMTPVGGALQTTVKTLQDLARDYGLTYDSAWLKRQSDLINNPDARTSLEDVAAEMAKAAAEMYPVFADRLGVGADGQITTVRDLAGSYIGQLSRLLEVDGAQIDLADPLLAKAFNSQMDESNKPKLMSLWDFQKEIRKDPRWQETGNALDVYSRIGSELTRAMGFAR